MEETNPNVLEENIEDRPSRGRLKTWQALMLLVVLAFGLRIFLLISPEVIHNDGIEYIRHAKLIALGDWMGGRASPFYPLTIALFHYFIPDYEIAGILVSVIFGSLVILPVFYIGKTILNEKVGILSALFAAVHPFLYLSSGSVLTESTYHFLLATSVLFGWRAFTRGRFWYVLLFSLFTTLAYLTRPEAMGFLFVFAIWALLINPPDASRRWTKRVGIILLAILSFVAFSSPYLIQIRKETGRWELSKKASVSIGSLSEEEEVPSVEMIKKKGLTLSSLIKNPVSVLGKIGLGFFDSLYKFQQVYNPILFLLGIWGLIFLLRKKKRHSLKISFYLMAYLIFFFGLVFPFFWVTRRYSSHMISISIPWATCGFLGITEWVQHRFDGEGVRKKLPILLLIFLLIGLFIQGRVIHTREFRVIRKEAGLWMKNHLPGGVKIMSRLPQEAFYAELPWIRIPEKNYEEILSVARSNKVRYFITDRNIQKDSPGFFDKIRGEDLVLIKDFKDKHQRMVIFEIVYPE